MDETEECKIVQDLLLGYVDNTLNKESQEIVEKHLKKCEDCKKKLQEIKEDIAKDEQKQQKEIDYLKRIRRKGRIKAIVLAIIIVLTATFVFYLTKFIKISSVMKNGIQYMESQNYYIESTMLTGDSGSSLRKTYYKDGKYKEVDEYYTDNGCEYRVIRYGEVDTDKIISINERDKKISIIKGDIVKLGNKKGTIQLQYVFSVEARTSFHAIWYKTFHAEIRTDTRQSNKPYYVLSDMNGEYWIDKETGLVIRSIDKQAEHSYYHSEGSRVLKSINDRTTLYEYKFNTVTDEDVEIPDLTEYTDYEIEEIEENFSDMINESRNNSIN